MSVYAIQAVDGGPIKVGYSADVDARLAQLQTSHHSELRVIDSFEAPPRTEQLFHSCLSEHRIRGEWYADHPAVHLCFRTGALAVRLEKILRAAIEQEVAMLGGTTWGREEARHRLVGLAEVLVDGLASAHEDFLAAVSVAA